MELKPGYKKTEVGVIPEDWEVRSLSELAELTSSKRIFENDYVSFGIPFYRGKEISLLIEGREIDDVCYITEQKFNEIKSRFGAPVKGEILITAVGTLGNVYVVDDDAPFYFKDGNLIWLRYVNKVNSKFLGIQLRCAKATIINSAIGSSQKALTIVVLKELQVSVPPVKEQQAIATALSDADALIEALEQLLAKKRQIKQGAMQELLTGQRRLPGFAGEWGTYLLGDLVPRLANGSMYQVADRDGVSVTRIETIATGDVDLNRVGQAVLSPALIDYKVRKHDILFSHINSLDHIGKVALFNGESDLYHGINLLLIRPGEKANGVFLYYWLSSNRARRLMRNMAKQAVSQASINTTELRGVVLKIPELTEQTAIAAVLSDMDAEIATLETKLAKARSVKQGMMQELLTGRIRLGVIE